MPEEFLPKCTEETWFLFNGGLSLTTKKNLEPEYLLINKV